jgi:2-dehydro-3-deoxyphosphooctonate aldolase (KDO 8-P synthase)
MQQVVNKCHAVGNKNIGLCDRGTSFGFNTLVSDMRSLSVMRETGCKIVFNVTHSVQQAGGLGPSSGGQREMVPVLARAAVAAGIDCLFMEPHPDPSIALSDGPNMIPLHHMEEMIETLLELDAVVKKRPFLESKIS